MRYRRADGNNPVSNRDRQDHDQQNERQKSGHKIQDKKWDKTL